MQAEMNDPLYRGTIRRASHELARAPPEPTVAMSARYRREQAWFVLRESVGIGGAYVTRTSCT